MSLPMLIALLALGPRPSAQPPSLRIVLERAGQYVAAYCRRLTAIVGEEQYVQDARTLSARQGTTLQHRALTSDLLLVRPEGADHYVQFRDVFDVDGKPVRDRQERLTRLFLENPSTGNAQAERIAEESARYNIGRIVRTINVPTLALMVLDPQFQSRFRFSRSSDDTPASLKGVDRSGDPSIPLFSTSTEVWVVSFRETETPTIIRTTSGQNIRATGRLWIEPATGRVLMTELVADRGGLRGEVDVTYAVDPSMDALVPAAMRERYLTGDEDISGYALYTRFRRVD